MDGDTAVRNDRIDRLHDFAGAVVAFVVVGGNRLGGERLPEGSQLPVDGILISPSNGIGGHFPREHVERFAGIVSEWIVFRL